MSEVSTVRNLSGPMQGVVKRRGAPQVWSRTSRFMLRVSCWLALVLPICWSERAPTI